MFRKACDPDLSRRQVQSARLPQAQLHQPHSLKWNEDGELSHVDQIAILDAMRRADDQSRSNNYCDIQ